MKRLLVTPPPGRLIVLYTYFSPFPCLLCLQAESLPLSIPPLIFVCLFPLHKYEVLTIPFWDLKGKLGARVFPLPLLSALLFADVTISYHRVTAPNAGLLIPRDPPIEWRPLSPPRRLALRLFFIPATPFLFLFQHPTTVRRLRYLDFAPPCPSQMLKSGQLVSTLGKTFPSNSCLYS